MCIWTWRTQSLISLREVAPTDAVGREVTWLFAG